MRTCGVVAAIAVAVAAVSFAWPETAAADRCYRPARVAAKATPVPPYFICLGTRNGDHCTVCPPGSQAVHAGDRVICLKACAKGFAWNPGSQMCCR
jgi:hypothetical protein